jgi:hypothetical protein
VIGFYQGSNRNILLAMNYLQSRVPHLDRPLAMAMTAYALALADSRVKREVNEKLQSMVQSTSEGITLRILPG